MPPTGARTTHRTTLAALAALTLIAAWLRLQGLPGPWGTDALAYVEHLVAGGPASGDPRTHRVLFLALVSLGRDIDPVAGASMPGALLSVAVVPVLWLAGRARLGDLGALVPSALWVFLGLDLEEVVEVSADAALALPGAVAALFLVRAREGSEQRVRSLVYAGVALGLGIALKETMLFAALGFGAGAACLGTGRERVRNGAALLVTAGLVGGALVLALTTGRADAVSANMAAVEAPIRWDSPGFLRRITIGMPAMLVTATGAFGVLMLVALPLLIRLPLRALRGDAVATAALVGCAAFALLPVSLDAWVVLPDNYPRYFLCLIPVLTIAVAETWRDDPESRLEWTVGTVAALLALGPMAAGGRVRPVVLLLGVAAAGWPLVRTRWGARVPPAWAGPAAAAAFLTAAWTGWVVRRPFDPAVLALSVVPLALLFAPPSRARWRPAALPLAAIGLAIAGTLARFSPDDWPHVWERLPARGRIVGESIVVRRLALAAPSGRDRERLVALVPDGPGIGTDPDARRVVRTTRPSFEALLRDPAWSLESSGTGETAVFRLVAE